MELSKAILSRRSIRNFKPDDVSMDHIMKLIQSAVYAPSAGNRQPWKFYVVKDGIIKEKICEEACRQQFVAAILMKAL